MSYTVLVHVANPVISTFEGDTCCMTTKRCLDVSKIGCGPQARVAYSAGGVEVISIRSLIHQQVLADMEGLAST